MRHLMSPLDFSVEELISCWIWRATLRSIQRNMHMPVMAKIGNLFL